METIYFGTMLIMQAERFRRPADAIYSSGLMRAAQVRRPETVSAGSFDQYTLPPASAHLITQDQTRRVQVLG